MSQLTPLTRPHAYLETVLAGLPQAPANELAVILREIARNLDSLAGDVERYLAAQKD